MLPKDPHHCGKCDQLKAVHAMVPYEGPALNLWPPPLTTEKLIVEIPICEDCF